MPEKFPEVYTQILASFLIAFLLVGFIVILLLLYRKKKKVQEREVQVMKNMFEKELLQTRLEIQENVLKNISMEIHDNIGQVMLLANVNVSMIQALPLPEQASPLIKETKTLLSKAIEDISQLSRSLHSDRITDIGVFTAIAHELELLQQKGLYQISISNELENNKSLLPNETQLILFRIFQEVSKNIIKHAAASRIDFSVHRNKDGLAMEIKDNGKGFDQTPGEHTANGIGLRSLHSRAKLIGGNLSISSILQEGTSVAIFIPLPKSE